MEQSMTFLPWHLKVWSPYPYLPQMHYFLNWYSLFSFSFLWVLTSILQGIVLWNQVFAPIWQCDITSDSVSFPVALLKRSLESPGHSSSQIFLGPCHPYALAALSDSRPLLWGQGQPLAALPTPSMSSVGMRRFAGTDVEAWTICVRFFLSKGGFNRKFSHEKSCSSVPSS